MRSISLILCLIFLTSFATAQDSELTPAEAVRLINLHFDNPYTGEGFAYVGEDPKNSKNILIYDWSFSLLVTLEREQFVTTIATLNEADQLHLLPFDNLLVNELDGKAVSQEQSAATKVPFRAKIYSAVPYSKESCHSLNEELKSRYNKKTIWKSYKKLIVACSELANYIYNESAEFPTAYYQASESSEVGSGRYSPSTGIINLEIEAPWTVELHERFHALQMFLDEFGSEYSLPSVLKAGATIEVDAIIATEVVIPQQLRANGVDIEKGTLEEFYEKAKLKNVDELRSLLVEIYLEPKKNYAQVYPGSWGEYWQKQLAPIYASGQKKYFSHLSSQKSQFGEALASFSAIYPSATLQEVEKVSRNLLNAKNEAVSVAEIDSKNKLEQLMVKARLSMALLKNAFTDGFTDSKGRDRFSKLSQKFPGLEDKINKAIKAKDFNQLIALFNSLRLLEEEVSVALP